MRFAELALTRLPEASVPSRIAPSSPTLVSDDPVTVAGKVVPVRALAATGTVMSLEPLKLTPLISRAVCSTVADPAFPVIVVWSPVFTPELVPECVPLKFEADTVPFTVSAPLTVSGPIVSPTFCTYRASKLTAPPSIRLPEASVPSIPTFNRPVSFKPPAVARPLSLTPKSSSPVGVSSRIASSPARTRAASCAAGVVIPPKPTSPVPVTTWRKAPAVLSYKA